MSQYKKIINIAVIAHVDAGKSTLVDAFLAQSGVFRRNEEVVPCVMDSDAIERERGITIYSKNCSVFHKGVKINIVDTPGHADFSSEVERIIRTVDTVILLVDSGEGPMPQTRFVLQKALQQGLKPILLINKIDKKEARIKEVVDMVYELFMDLNATDEQLDFPILYGIARQGAVTRSPEEDAVDLEPLFETIIRHGKGYPDRDGEPLQFQISALAYDEYIGRLGIGRISRGTLKPGQPVSVVRGDGTVSPAKAGQVFLYRGMKREAVPEAGSGDIAVVSGIADLSIGETVCDERNPEGLPRIEIEEPTLSMMFLVNKSPFAGRSGRFVTSRHLRERLRKELEVNVGLVVEETGSPDSFKVSGRGELHLSVLLENMRREGYELAVSKPEVILRRDEKGRLLEPMEEVIITVADQYAGTVISALNARKGVLRRIEGENGYSRLSFLAPTRGLIGYRSRFINETRGEGILVRRFDSFGPHKGEIPGRVSGTAVSMETGTATAYGLFGISERVRLFVSPGDKVYEGMVVGMNSRGEDMTVNPCKAKKTTNMRAAGSEDALKLPPARTFTLEDALEFISDDELAEVTPDAVRIRKKLLREQERRRSGK